MREFGLHRGGIMTEDRSSPDRASGSPSEVGASIAELSDDNLLAIFLKLNVQDPNDDPETHALLHSIRGELRKRGLEDEALRRSKEDTRARHRPP
jgi:hypothetical protein